MGCVGPAGVQLCWWPWWGPWLAGTTLPRTPGPRQDHRTASRAFLELFLKQGLCLLKAPQIAIKHWICVRTPTLCTSWSKEQQGGVRRRREKTLPTWCLVLVRRADAH